MGGASIAVMVLVVIGAVLWVMRGRLGAGGGDARRRAGARVKAKRKVEVEGRTKHIVAFSLDDGDEELLDVDASTFDRLNEGDVGTLVWEDTRFVRFAADA